VLVAELGSLKENRPQKVAREFRDSGYEHAGLAPEETSYEEIEQVLERHYDERQARALAKNIRNQNREFFDDDDNDLLRNQ